MMEVQKFRVKELPTCLFANPADKNKFTPDSQITTKSELARLNLSIRVLPGAEPVKIDWTFGEEVFLTQMQVSTRSSKLMLNDGICGNLRISLWDNSFLLIGSDSTFSQCRFVLDRKSRCSLGNDLLVSDGVSVQLGDQHALVDLDTRTLINPAPSELTVGDHVWIGRDAKVVASQSLRIGSGSVVGMSSVVTSNIPENSLYAGVPAREIRKKISWHRSRHPSPQEVDCLITYLQQLP